MNTKKKLLLILAVVVVLVILFFIFKALVENGLGQRIAEANALFENGTGGQPGIASELQTRLEAADELQSIAAKYGDAAYTEYSALRDTNNELRALLKEHHDTGWADLGRMFDLNEALSKHFVSCREVLEPLTEGKAHAALGEYQSVMEEAQAVINKSGYNSAIRDFTETVLNRFPNGILKGLVKEKAPMLWESAQ